MKQTILLFILVIGSTSNAQTIRIADNNTNRPTGANIFSTLQAAIDAAVPDDIVYITPSTTSYGNATLGKKITLKGVGFGVTEIEPRSSTLGTLTIVNSSNGVDNVSGATLTGFSFSTVQFAIGIGGSTYDNITFDNVTGSDFNHTSGSLPNTNNLTIRNSIIYQINIGASAMSNTKIYKNAIYSALSIGNTTNPLITNNLFFSQYPYYGSYSLYTANCPGIRIEHNIFSGTGVAFSNLVNALVVNNIFYGRTPDGAGAGTTLYFSSNTFSNNLVLSNYTWPPPASNGTANSGVGNISGTGPLFTNAPVSASYNDTYNYTLQAGSACIGSATTGENIGPSGGLYPWTGNISLKVTAVPVITLFGNSGVVPQNQPLKSNIKAKSN
jgi:hypothetical protein